MSTETAGEGPQTDQGASRFWDRLTDRMSAASHAASRSGTRAWTRAGRFRRDNIDPSAARIGKSVRAHAKPSAMRRDYRYLLSIVHDATADRQLDKLFFHSTRVATSLEDMSIVGANGTSGHDCRATPALVFEWAMSVLPDSLKEYAFIDFGSGLGRAMLLATGRNFKYVRGLEFAKELHEDAVLNIAQYPRSRMRCRDVESLLCDAAEYDLPDDPLVCYFFNPFDAPVLWRSAKNILDAYANRPRRIYCIFVDMPDAHPITQSQSFFELDYEPREAFLLKMFSPYVVRAYRSVV